MNGGLGCNGYREGSLQSDVVCEKKLSPLLTSVATASSHNRHEHNGLRDDKKRAYCGGVKKGSARCHHRCYAEAAGGLVGFDGENDGSSHSQRSGTQWVERSPLSCSYSNENAFSCCSFSLAGGTSQEGKAVAEFELMHTRELLLHYKNYVEKRLLRYVQALEEERGRRDQLCKRLKRDNALLLEELDRYRATTSPLSSSALRNQRHLQPMEERRRSPFIFSNSLPQPLFAPEDDSQDFMRMLRRREDALLCQLHEEKACRARMEAAHADAVRRLQAQVAALEEEKREGIDATTIHRLREVLSRRDEEIRQLRKLHGFLITKPLGEGERDSTEDFLITELRQTAENSVEFVTAMNATATTAFGNDIDVNSVLLSWEEVRRTVVSLPNVVTASSPMSVTLVDVLRLMRCAMEKEHNRMALLVRRLLCECEDLRGSLAHERRERSVERQAALRRLSEAEGEGAAVVQKLQKELSAITQRASSCICPGDFSAEHKRAGDAAATRAEGRSVTARTLPLAENSSGAENDSGARLACGDGLVLDSPVRDINDCLCKIEALERDNAEKATLIARLQQQRRRFLSGVDAELALSPSSRAALAAPFCQYLLE